MSEMSAQSAETVDERSDHQVTAAAEAIFEADHAKFVAAVLEGSADTSIVAGALGDVAENVRQAGISVARAALSGPAAAGKGDAILTALAKAVDADAAKGEQPLNRAEDHVRGAIIALYGHCADTGIPKEDEARRELALKRIVKALHVVGDHGAFIAAPALAPLAGDLGAAAAGLVEQLRTEALSGVTAEVRRAGAAAVAGIINGLGGGFMGTFGIVPAITAALNSKKDATARAGGCALYTFMCRTAGRSFEPFAVGLAPTIFCMQGDQSSDVRIAANAAQSAVVKALPLTAMKLLAPALVAAMHHKVGRSLDSHGACGTQRVPCPGCAPLR
jgi:elongation factor 3